MPYRLEPFADVGLDEALLRLVLDEHRRDVLPRLEHWWTYYRNASEPGPVPPAGAGRLPHRARLAQERGLPPRLTGLSRDPAADDRTDPRRELVIENDIAWRVHTMVDFMFGKPVQFLSTAPDPRRRRQIERLLDAVWEASGGNALMQDMALLGHVYGHVDLLLRADTLQRLASLGALDPDAPDDPEAMAPAWGELVRIEVIEPTRGVPLLNPGDYRALDAYIVRYQRELNRVDRAGDLEPLGGPGASRRWGPRAGAGAGVERRRVSTSTEVFSATRRQLYEDDRLVEDVPLRLTDGRVPVVHVQNVAQPFRYAGLGEVEPLVPLQDELNTRLSDRAARVTMQTFKMYLARGIEGFDKMPVGPGLVVTTDNPDASVQTFGGDGEAPSESAHIGEVRQALDRASGVPAVASGVIDAKIGNLSSANALRVTMVGLLARTARKRVTYGRGLAEMCRMVLAAFDGAGVYRTEPHERGVRLVWPDPLPIDETAQVRTAREKVDLGVPEERVLSELGYAPTDPGVV